ncbi:MAG: alpha/beta hydrolase [Chitinophagales bacterium]|jgi:acetyl esterase/lipase|nr:alpha/beta hydrolase [Chitinophagales bacterium]
MRIKILAALLLYSTFMFSQKEILLYSTSNPEKSFIEENEIANGTEWITFVSRARMYMYPADKKNKRRTSVLICPGGGYGGLAAQKEGVEIAHWFNSLGVTAFVLYYRMPFAHHEIPLKDAKTAIQIIRNNSRQWDLNKKRIGVIGFSAGGHLAATLGTHFDKFNKPNFMALIYPVISFRPAFFPGGTCENLLGKNPPKELINFYSNELHATKHTPPTFLVHALNDEVVEPLHSQAFADSLKSRKVNFELVLYKNGGHGFGMRPQNVDADQWPNRLKEWLKAGKFI